MKVISITYNVNLTIIEHIKRIKYVKRRVVVINNVLWNEIWVLLK